jgi:hypothetical protein
LAVAIATLAGLCTLGGTSGLDTRNNISVDANIGNQPTPAAAHVALGVSRKKIDFGKVPAGTQSSPQTVTITNEGNIQLPAAAVSVTGTGFNLGSNGCTGGIPAMGSCPVSVIFAPPSKGKFKHGRLTITDTAVKSSEKVKLVGVGLSITSTTATPTATAGRTATPTMTPTAAPTATPTGSAKAWVDANNHINYGRGGPTFPVVIYDMNPNPIIDIPELLLASFDTFIPIAIGSAIDAEAFVNALPLDRHLWSVVPNGVGYTGSDPGFPAELESFIGLKSANVTGYYVCDEPQTASDIATCNSLTNTALSIDSGSLPNSTFNDATFGGGYPNYSGGPFANFAGKVLAVDPYGNNSWNLLRPESKGHYDFTSEVKTWMNFATAAFPNQAVGCFTAFYNGSCFPSKREMYDAMWSCIVNDADYAGLWAYGRQVSGAASCDGSPSETAAQRWADATEMINHFAAIKDVFIQPPVAAVSGVTPPQSVIGWRALPRSDGTVWIFASNYTSSAVDATFTLSGTWGSIIAYADKSDSSNRKVCSSNCAGFNDSFPLFSSHVYKLSP